MLWRALKNVENGFYQTVITQRLQLWGPFPEWWQGTPPLPAFIAVPYAWLLPLAEIVFDIGLKNKVKVAVFLVAEERLPNS